MILREGTIMTLEQFCFWIKGYLCGGRDNDLDCIVNDIVKQIKKVKLEEKLMTDDDEIPCR
jgi:hypothetical protein